MATRPLSEAQQLVIEKMKAGHKLFWGILGPYLDSHGNVHVSVARGLYTRGLIEVAPEQSYGDTRYQLTKDA